MSRKQIGTVDDFPEGEATKVEIGRVPISVFNVDGELYAIHNVCVHKNLPMDSIGDEQTVSEELREEGQEYTYGHIDEEELTISCPWHHLDWNLETGYNPVLDASIPTFEVEIENDDVFIQTG